MGLNPDGSTIPQQRTSAIMPAKGTRTVRGPRFTKPKPKVRDARAPELYDDTVVAGIRQELTAHRLALDGQERSPMPADLAVLALGFDAVPDPDLVAQLHLAVDSRGRVTAKEHATRVAGVFVAGDLATGQTRVADAIASGRRAAEKIDQYLRG